MCSALTRHVFDVSRFKKEPDQGQVKGGMVLSNP